ncbi:unnamed protein product [Caenorhabditis nigoni]
MSQSLLISEELKKEFAIFSDRIKDDDLPETFVSDEIVKLEKLEENLKKKKEVLQSRIDRKAKRFRVVKLCIFLFMVIAVSSIAGTIFYPPNQQDGPGPFPKIGFGVAAVILLSLFGFVVYEGVMDQIANWKRRRNTNNSLENGDKTNETEIDNLKNRYQAMLKDLNENYEPMRNRYKRLCDQYIFCYIVGNLTVLIISICTAIESFFYNTKQDRQKTLIGILQLFVLFILPVSCYKSAANELAKDKKIQF